MGTVAMVGLDLEKIAKVCHEANRAYCETLGDSSLLRWEESPEWQKDSMINGVDFHIRTFRSFGRWPKPSESHESWMKRKEADGWKYGPVKDEAKKEHPCFLPYDELPIEQRTKDFIFSGIVQAIYASIFTATSSPVV